LPHTINRWWTAVDTVEALAPDTVVVRWNRPWVEADLMFSNPYPKHLLEAPLTADPSSLPALPYFTDEYVGTGPFRLREFVRDSHVSLQANAQYVLGRPKIDEIDVRFIPDPNTLAANLLAGQVQLTLGTSVPLELAVEIRDQWPEGTLRTRPIDNVVALWPQHKDPRPAIIGDPRFRRALWHAIDRQLLVDSIQAGMAPIAHGKIPPHDPLYADVETALVKYDYDPRTAARMIEGLGYARNPDGFFRDRSGETLTVDLRTGGLQVAQKALFPIRDDWQQVGVKVDAHVIPPQQYNDGEYRASRPGFELSRHSASVVALQNYLSRTIPSAENRYTGGNKPHYYNPEMDAIVEQLQVAIPRAQRVELLRQILRHASEQAVNLYLYYDVGPTLLSSRVRGVDSGNVVLGAHLWTVN
jgi:peptide/nickel transport system substrate-binding protein